MPNLTSEGLRAVSEIAARHGFSVDAASGLLDALLYGQGTQAQFNHFEFGGMGQWSRGGMIMIGDMFNNGLKYRVDALCNDLSDLLGRQQIVQAPAPSFQSQSQGGGIFAQPHSNWWPSEFGQPSSSGAQNDMRYAFFPGARRLVVQHGGKTQIYDSGDHLFGGVSQQQGGGQTLSFNSQFGTVQASDLRRVSDETSASAEPAYTAPQQTHSSPPLAAEAWAPEPAQAPAPVASSPTTRMASDPDNVLKTIKSLAALRQEGILTEEEFAAKKAELLSRI